MLLDVSLPDGDGFEVCRRVVEFGAGHSQIPVIFISSHDDTSTKLKGFEVGGVDYVTKPIVKAELLARVTTHLRLKQAYDMLVDLQAERIKRLSTVQESLMPRPADLPNASFAVVLDQMNQAGGDFYDVIPVGEEMVDYLVADVSGHDLGSSLWTSAIKTLLAEYATPANTPLDVVHTMNRVLSRILPDGVFFTLIYVRLNRRGKRMRVLQAGHPPPLMVSRGRTGASTSTAESDVVGVFSDATFQFREFQVTRGIASTCIRTAWSNSSPAATAKRIGCTALGEKARDLPLTGRRSDPAGDGGRVGCRATTSCCSGSRYDGTPEERARAASARDRLATDAVDGVCRDLRAFLSTSGVSAAGFGIELVARELLNNAVLHGNRIRADAARASSSCASGAAGSRCAWRTRARGSTGAARGARSRTRARRRRTAGGC